VTPPTRFLGDELIRQLSGHLDPPALSELRERIAGAVRGEPVEPILGASGAYWRDLAGHTLEARLRALAPGMHVLVVHGLLDPMLPAEDALDFWERHPELASDAVTVLTVPGDHVLMAAPPSPGAPAGRYALDEIAAWLEAAVAG
jgi:fermentation-respiration switch protein FrsA (DUF1100 family)